MKLPTFIVRPLLHWALRVAESRDPDQRIGPTNDPYMLRWIVFRRKKIGGLYLHIFRKDDDDRALHDHPFASLSIVVAGKMREIYSEKGWNPADIKQHSARMIDAGHVVWRGAEFSHRIELIDGSAMTLFFIGPHVRSWGFWCPKGWRHWKDYCDPFDPNKVGPGCD